MTAEIKKDILQAIGMAEGLDWIGVAVKIDFKGQMATLVDWLDKCIEHSALILIGETYFLSHHAQYFFNDQSLKEEAKL